MLLNDRFDMSWKILWSKNNHSPSFLHQLLEKNSDVLLGLFNRTILYCTSHKDSYTAFVLYHKLLDPHCC